MEIHRSVALFQYQGEDIYLFTLKNKHGLTVSISNLGAIIQSFKVPNKEGGLTDIVLGFDNISDYLKPDYLETKTYFGAIIGRYANRVENSSFELDGKRFYISPNLPPHQLHGGFEGFDKKAWKIEKFNKDILKLSYLSKDLEEGYPGDLEVKISFSLNDDNELILLTEASSNKATPINLTHHDYFNLNGYGLIDDHFVQILASKYLAQKSDFVVSGEILSVKETNLDFSKFKQINHDWNPDVGYDQSFLLDKDYGSFSKAASAYSEKSGIKLDVFTDEPTLQFYTSKHLNIPFAKNGQNYMSFAGFCFECQHHCNALNISNFPTTILRPNELYSHSTHYKISLIK